MAVEAADRGTRSRWRNVISWVLVVLTGIAVTGSVIGFWVHRTVLDTDAFMASVTPIVESESVQTLVSDRISDELIERLDLETRLSDRIAQAEARLRERLAEALDLPVVVERRLQNAELGLGALAPMIAAGVETRIRDAVERFVTSPEGSRLLLDTIEVAHERSVLLLRNEMDQLPNLVVTEGEVRLNLVPLVAEVLRAVVNSGLDVIGIDREIPAFDSSEDATAAVERLAAIVGRELPPDFAQVPLASEASVERAQGLVRAFDLALWLLAITAVLLAIVAVWLAPSIPSGLVRIGVAATIAAIVGWLLVQVLSNQVADAAATPDGRVAAADIVRALVSGLSGTAFALAVIGVGLVGAGIVADRSMGPAVPVSPAPLPPTAVPATPVPTAAAPRKPPAPAAEAETSSTPPKPPPAKRGTAKPSSTKRAAPKPSTTTKRRRPPATGA